MEVAWQVVAGGRHRHLDVAGAAHPGRRRPQRRASTRPWIWRGGCRRRACAFEELVLPDEIHGFLLEPDRRYVVSVGSVGPAARLRQPRELHDLRQRRQALRVQAHRVRHRGRGQQGHARSASSVISPTACSSAFSRNSGPEESGPAERAKREETRLRACFLHAHAVRAPRGGVEDLDRERVELGPKLVSPGKILVLPCRGALFELGLDDAGRKPTRC